MLIFSSIICVCIGSVLCKKKEHIFKANSCFATFGNFDWGKINLSKIFQLLNDDVLLHVLVVGEQEKKNLEHEVCISLYLGVFSCATVYKLMHSF